MTDDPYLSDSRYNMFKNIKNKNDFKEVVEKLNTIELIGFKLPANIKDDYEYALYEVIQSRLGMYDYTEIRHTLFSEWGGKKSLEEKVEDLEEESMDKINNMSDEIKKILIEVRNIKNIYKKIMEAVGNNTMPIKIKDYVGDIDNAKDEF